VGQWDSETVEQWDLRLSVGCIAEKRNPTAHYSDETRRDFYHNWHVAACSSASGAEQFGLVIPDASQSPNTRGGAPMSAAAPISSTAKSIAAAPVPSTHLMPPRKTATCARPNSVAPVTIWMGRGELLVRYDPFNLFELEFCVDIFRQW